MQPGGESGSRRLPFVEENPNDTLTRRSLIIYLFGYLAGWPNEIRTNRERIRRHRAPYPLRLITTGLKITTDLERIGDQAVNICECALQLISEPPLLELFDISAMGRIAQRMVRESLEAFVRRDPALAIGLCGEDDEVDALVLQITPRTSPRWSSTWCGERASGICRRFPMPRREGAQALRAMCTAFSVAGKSGDGLTSASTDDKVTSVLERDPQPRASPFRGFGVPSPAVLQRLAAAAEAKAIHKLVAAVQRIEGCAAATLEAAQAADAAASAVEEAMASMLPVETALRTARQARDDVGQQWDRDLAALKRQAQAAADDGAPHLHAALFPSVGRTSRKQRQQRGRGGPR